MIILLVNITGSFYFVVTSPTVTIFRLLCRFFSCSINSSIGIRNNSSNVAQQSFGFGKIIGILDIV